MLSKLKLFRVGPIGQERPAVEIDGKAYDISEYLYDYDQAFWDSDGLQQLPEWVQNIAYLPQIDPNERIGPPIATPSKIIGIGLNYKDHATETGAKIPAEPVIFFKAPSSYCGPFDDVYLPPGAQKLDWEVELAIVIGKKASFVCEAEAMDYIAGYTLLNDVSERSYQMERGGTWDKGKGFDRFAPTGPYLIPKEAIEDVQNLDLWLKVNGKICQQSNTREMIFSVAYLVHYVSQFITLLPGDIITTGTPAGVGLGMQPPQYLKVGDIMELGIAQIGSARQSIVDYPSKGF